MYEYLLELHLFMLLHKKGCVHAKCFTWKLLIKYSICNMKIHDNIYLIVYKCIFKLLKRNIFAWKSADFENAWWLSTELRHKICLLVIINLFFYFYLYPVRNMKNNKKIASAVTCFITIKNLLNKKAWMTAIIFFWFHNCFVLEVFF